MATISYAVPASGGHPAIRNLAYLMEVVVDFAVVAGDVTIGTTDTVQVLKIPAGSLVLSAGANVKTAETTNTTARLKLLRDTTLIVDDFAKEAGNDNGTGPNKIGSVSTTYLDSPSSTSALTYKVQLMSGSDSSLAQMGASGAKSTITLMEISG
mgnify:CR=1 FL=1